MDKGGTRSGRTVAGAKVPGASGRASGESGKWPNIKMIALDLDGTLLSSRKSITPKTHTAVKLAMKKGVRVVLATARPPRSVRDYYKALKLDTPVVNYNGALIWDGVRERVVEHVPLDVEVAKQVIAYGRKKFTELLVSIEILDKWYTDHFSEIPEYMTETAKQFSPDFVGPLEAFLTRPITKLMLLGNPKWIESLGPSIQRRFGKVVGVTRSDPHLLQLMNPTISKAKALAKVAGGLGIDAKHVMAIGDAPNDVEMLKWAGLSIVPENGWEEAKKVADAVVGSNDADGVAEAIGRWVL